MWRLLFLLAPALGFNLHQEPPPPMRVARQSYETRWVNVRVNHFDATNNDTFPMRFFYNRRSHSTPNIVIFVGGEWEITPNWVTGGFGLDLAGYADASLFYTEHRYYGLTRPTEAMTIPELRFLNIDQALADLAQFITYVKSDAFEQGRYGNAKVLLVGCSYAGTMATWMRVQYPHLIDAALSDSGPLHAQEDFPEYLQVVGEAMRQQGGEECYSAVQQASQQAAQLLTTTNGRAQISQLFNTCAPLSASNLDIISFQWYGLIYSFAGLVQSALPGQVANACAQITNTTAGADPLERMARWVRSQQAVWGETCIETRYEHIVAQYRNTSFDNPATADFRAWIYQTCVEYGWYQTTNSPNQPFGSGVPLTYFQQLCMDLYSPFFNETIAYGVSRTNLFYGGLNGIPDRVVSVQGQFDPWHPMGPNATHSRPLAPVHFVPDISHCRIIYSISQSETEEVRQVKQQVVNEMLSFIGVVLPSSAPKAVSSVALLLVVALRML